MSNRGWMGIVRLLSVGILALLLVSCWGDADTAGEGEPPSPA